jgi:hypothetical protein
MTRTRAFLTLLVTAALVPAVSAEAAGPDGTYRGRTSQGYKVVLKVQGGKVQSVSVPWVGHCRSTHSRWGPVKPNRWTNDPADPIEQQGDSFSDSGRARGHYQGARWVTTAHLKGHFDGNRVSGRQTATVRFRAKNGRRDFCKSTVRWSAKLAG